MLVEFTVEVNLDEEHFLKTLIERQLTSKKLLGQYLMMSLYVDSNDLQLPCVSRKVKGWGYLIGNGSVELCSRCSVKDSCRHTQHRSGSEASPTSTTHKRIDCYSHD